MIAAILGSTGYAGQVLIRLLLNHPEITQVLPSSSSSAGKTVLDEDPGLSPQSAEKLTLCGGRFCTVADVAAANPDVLFAALPHLKSAELAGDFVGKAVIIDLSADFRIADPALFEAAYGQAPPRPDLLDRAVFGLSEWNSADIAGADLIANPGCYPTATLLPLLPVMKAGMVGGPVIVNALSGISGAGKKAKEQLLYTTRTENAAAYAPGRTHRHWQEIVSHAGIIGGFSGELYFTPHLVPIHHGMAVTTSLKLRGGSGSGAPGVKPVSDEMLEALFTESYGDSPFVRLRRDIPETSQVRGTNRCDFTWHLEGDQLFLISVIDNLYKGASGQAVQNMNIRFGFDQTSGLNLHGEI